MDHVTAWDFDNSYTAARDSQPRKDTMDSQQFARELRELADRIDAGDAVSVEIATDRLPDYGTQVRIATDTGYAGPFERITATVTLVKR